MSLSDLNSLDFHNISGWPVTAKVIGLILICAAPLGAGYWFDTRHQIEELKTVAAKEQELKQTFEFKQAKAVNLEAYKLQLTEMKRSFGAMLRQLPSKAEVADLLVDISQTGLASGLEFELFSPKAELPKDFYAELPISMRVTGSYHEFGEFVSGVAALPRIVTLHDISVRHPSEKEQRLVMEVTAKTYRYVDEPTEETPSTETAPKEAS